jgi:two-component system KDP operon response regulator KdpE
MAGVEVCREIRKWSGAWIVVLSVRDSDRDKASLFEAGADDYVTKPFSKLEFTARIRAHQRRVQAAMRQPTPQPMTFGDLVINISARTIWCRNKPIHLTPIEWDLLRLFVMHTDRTLTHSTLLNEIWGSGAGSPLLSLQVHIANLRRKIEQDASRPRRILTEPGVGYRWAGDFSPGDAL